MSLSQMIKEGYGKKENFSCAEKILYGANEAYKLGLDKEAMKMSAGLAAGLYVGEACGALSAGALVLAKLFIKEIAHEGPYLSGLVTELFETFKNDMGDITCTPLKAKYRTEEKLCYDIIYKAAVVLDKIVERELAAAEKMAW